MEKIREKFIETIGNLGEGLGLNRTTCQIYALLYVSEDPLSPTEIGKQLEMSKGNVSINLKKLEEWNAIEKVWRKGYARSLYKANDNIEEIIKNKLKSGIEKRINQIQQSFKDIQSNLSKNDNKETEYITKKINDFKELIKKIELIIQTLNY